MKNNLLNINKKSTSLVALCFLVVLFFLQIFTSRWTVRALEIPQIVNQALTLLEYLPFLGFALVKLILDIKSRKLTLFSKFYYGFIGYYAVLTGVRFFTGAEVKENLYSAIILIGSIAFFSLLATLSSKEDKFSLSRIILIFSIVLVVYWLVYNLFIKSITYSPINEIAMGVSFLLLIIALVSGLKGGSKLENRLTFAALFCMTVFCMTLASRVVLFILMFELVALLIINIKNKDVWKKLLACVLSAVAVVSILFALNVGDVRYAVYRELNIGISDSQTNPNSPHKPSKEQQSAAQQVEASDNMRHALSEMNMKEIKKNVLFGTGKTLFSYSTATEDFNVLAHNFILTTLSGFGLVGLVLLAILVIVLLKDLIITKWKNTKSAAARLSLLLTFVSFFGVGLVQASVYDMLILPIMFVIVAMFQVKINCQDA